MGEILDFRADFYKGQYNGILQATVDGPRAATDVSNAQWVIGALSFQGRLFEAETLYSKFSSELTPDSNAAAQSFLAINCARASEYAKARSYIVSIASARNLSNEANFYFLLALAFYHSTQGHQSRAETYAIKALGRALDLEFPYGKILARDLLAHTYIQNGRFSAAFSQFRLALNDANQLGEGAIAEAVRVSFAIHSARHGFAPDSDLVNLESILSTLSDQDSFSAGKLLMEIGRQNVLRGRADRAREYYARASKVVSAQQLPWYSSRLAVRQSYLAWICGEQEEAKQILLGAESVDREQNHSQTRAEFCGLRKLLGLETGNERLAYNAIDARITRRAHNSDTPPHPRGDDPLGDLLDLVEIHSPRAADIIMRDGYFGLLAKLPGFSRNSHSINFAIIPTQMVVCERGTIRVADIGGSSLLESVVTTLAQGWCSKEHLIQSVWGYQYNPSRHDALVYNTISRFRDLLPANWILSVDGKYRLIPAIEIVTSDVSHESVEPIPLAKPTRHSMLSHRQVRLAKFIEDSGPVDARAVGAFLGLSEVSARRELSHLVKEKYIERIGNGRATSYNRTPNPSSSHAPS